MALGILGAYGGLNKKEVPDCLFVGELSLDGAFAACAGRCLSPSRRAARRSLLDVIRFVNTGNSILPPKVDSDTLLGQAQHYAVERLLERAMTQHGMTARAHDRIRKVARTVADLKAAPAIQPKPIAEAIQYRT